jgi:hypothetical protein
MNNYKIVKAELKDFDLLYDLLNEVYNKNGYKYLVDYLEEDYFISLFEKLI